MIPVLISGKERGRADFSSSGLYTIMDITVDKADGIVRLYAHGSGKDSYIGIPSPKENTLRLTKKYSPSELLTLPAEIEYISDAPSAAAKQKTAFPPEMHGHWSSQSDGTLSRPGYIAIPCRNDKSFPHCRTEIIEGRQYMLFVY